MFFYFLYKNKKDLYKRQKDFGETKKSLTSFSDNLRHLFRKT